MAMMTVRLARRVTTILGVCGLLTLTGCGNRFNPKPVSGKVTVDGEPLTHFRVSFVPDADKGNNNAVACLGKMDDQGRYELQMDTVNPSDRGRGAPLGWYKVVLQVVRGDPPCDVDRKFTKVETTPLSIEVVDNPQPDHYDLKMTLAKNSRSKPLIQRYTPGRKQREEKMRQSQEGAK